MNFDSATDRLRFDRPIAGVDIEISVFRHANFNLHPARLVPAKSPMAADARSDLNAVAILAGIDVQSPVDLVPLIKDSKFDLLGLAGINLHSAVVGLDSNVGAACDGVRFCPVFGAD